MLKIKIPRGGEIQNIVRNRGFAGAWISSVPEKSYGDRGIALSDSLEMSENQPNIQKVHDRDQKIAKNPLNSR